MSDNTKKQEDVKVEDNRGFHYTVTLEHYPHHGYSMAKYEGRFIAQVDLYKIHEPQSDDDREWEYYEERFAEWRDEIIQNMQTKCIDYLSNKQWQY